MIKAYRYLYERIEVFRLDGKPTGHAWVLKKLEKPWYEHLTPGHRKFFDSLEPVEQLVCSLSCDPFYYLKLLWQEKNK